MLDVHCHILPKVDDGSDSKEESLAMLHGAKDVGIDKIVCTPHYKDSSYSQEAIDEAYKWFEKEASKEGIETLLGNEIHWRKISQFGIDTVLDHTIGNTGFALIEFSSNSDIGQMERRLLWKLRGKGIIPIIAHPERYAVIQDNIDLAYDLKDAGCLLQLSANAVTAPIFSNVKKTYKRLLNADLYDLLASDAHCVDDYKKFAKALRAASSIQSSEFSTF